MNQDVNYYTMLLKKYNNRSTSLINMTFVVFFVYSLTNDSKYRKYMKSMVKISENNKVSIHFSTRIMLLLGVHILMHMYVDVRYYF